MNRLTYILVTVLLLSGFTGCRKKDSTVKLPEVDPKLVLVSFISPQDSVIRVVVTLSQPLYNNAAANNYEPVQNAVVVISSDLGQATLQFSAFYKAHVADSSQLKIREGHRYTITVTTPDGKRAQAETTVPSQNTSLTMKLSDDSTSVRCNWTDAAGSKDYYRVFLQNSSYFIFEGYDNQYGQFQDTIYTNYASSEWMTDDNKDGQNLGVSMNYENSRYEELEHYLYLIHASNEYYDYGTRLLIAQNSGNPFAEPVIMYSNVRGGFGVFAGYSSFRLKVD